MLQPTGELNLATEEQQPAPCMSAFSSSLRPLESRVMSYSSTSSVYHVLLLLLSHFSRVRLCATP